LPIGPTTSVVRSSPITSATRSMAACLETGGLLTGATAAAAHGLWSPSRPIEVVVERASGRYRQDLVIDRQPVFVHTTRSLPAEDRHLLDGIPITSVARTLLAMASKVPEGLSQDRLVALVSAAIDVDLASTAWLWWMLERRRRSGRRGVSALAAALAEVCALGATESWLERHFLTLVSDAWLPTPTVQHVVRRSGRFVARVDFLFEPFPVVTEVLGYGFHRTREQLDADTRRVNDLQLAGYQVLQFTFTHLVRSPSRSMTTLRSLLVAHGLHLPRSDKLAG
jgi:hypothetical protein